MNEEYLTVKQAACRLHVTPATVRRWYRTDRVFGFQSGEKGTILIQMPRPSTEAECRQEGTT